MTHFKFSIEQQICYRGKLPLYVRVYKQMIPFVAISFAV